MRFPAIILILLGLVGIGTIWVSQNDNAGGLPDVVDFNEHIRPILSSNCYVCHGPDISTREAGLRLDLRDSAIVELESGNTAVVPGNSSASALIHRIVSEDAEERMPPPELKKVLSEVEVGLLKKWIDQGAEWQDHWSLVPPEKPAIPPVRRSWQVENDIDRFVVATLEKKGLAPAERASKESLIRRLSFVLTGLPPTPEGVQAFLADESEDAYEKLVDRLLDSPHFGERWARHWMDLVRYANTRGHEFDYPVIGANQYRDYLIRAFNEDVPYDQLVTEHLAGDLIENPRINASSGLNESEIGTLFYALGEGKHSPVDTKIEEMERNDIVIDVTSKTFQGLTVSCARCHDHKFDPIPTTDYYALYSIIRSSRYAMRASNITDKAREQVASLQSKRQQLRGSIADYWLADIADDLQHTAEVADIEIPQGQDTAYSVIGDFSAGDYDGWMADGQAFEEKPAPGHPVFEAGQFQQLATPRASSATLTPRLFGTLRSPDFVLEHDYITVGAAGDQARIRVIMDNFHLIQNPIYGGLEVQVDTSAMQNYTFDLKMWRGRKMYLELLPARYQSHRFIRADSAYIEATFAIAHNEKEPAYLEELTTSRAATNSDVRRAIQNWRDGSADRSDIALINSLLAAEQLNDPTLAVADLIEETDELVSEIAPVEVYMGTIEGMGEDHPVFVQGSMNTPSDSLVPRRGLTIHDKSQAAYQTPGSGRMHFAEALLAPENPLTARVMVNRLWHYVFGRGIVETVDNFGVQGKYPSHPALLDFLAIEFVEQNWSVKQMLREMVLSRAFQRSTVASEKAGEMDPQNIYLQHYPVRRLEAEAIRDAILVTSGRFDPTMYGDDIPIHLTEFMEGRGRPRASGPLDGDGRRSIYLSIRRNFLSPFMLVFDMPIPFTTFGKRNTSNVPAQSLTLLNDPFVVDQAEHWARELVTLKELGIEQKVEHIYWKGFARAASAEEIEDATVFLAQQAQTYGLSMEEVLNDTRPWRDFCHTIFNMKEFIHLV